MGHDHSAPASAVTRLDYLWLAETSCILEGVNRNLSLLAQLIYSANFNLVDTNDINYLEIKKKQKKPQKTQTCLRRLFEDPPPLGPWVVSPSFPFTVTPQTAWTVDQLY